MSGKYSWLPVRPKVSSLCLGVLGTAAYTNYFQVGSGQYKQVRDCFASFQRSFCKLIIARVVSPVRCLLALSSVRCALALLPIASRELGRSSSLPFYGSLAQCR